MIKIENAEIVGWEAAIRGMRNPMNSWEKSDSFECVYNNPIFDSCEKCVFRTGEEPNDICIRGDMSFVIGPNDHKLMMKLRNAGTDHRKFMRMIVVYLDITAPLYWWKEFDTYKVGTVANSCSTMHKIHEKEFTLEDFSCEDLMTETVGLNNFTEGTCSYDILKATIDLLNYYRRCYIEDGRSKDDWRQLIQLLPSSYNQKRTVMLNYEVLANMYKSRRNHKLDEWRDFCDWINELPYSELITGQSLGDLPICNETMEEAKKRVTNEGENK